LSPYFARKTPPELHEKLKYNVVIRDEMREITPLWGEERMKKRENGDLETGIDWSSLYKKEDWWAVWIGFIILGLASMRVVTWMPKIGKWTTDVTISINAADTSYFISVWLPNFILAGAFLLALTGVVVLVLKERLKNYLLGFSIVFLLAFASFLIANQSFVAYLGLEFVLWALLIGLLISNTIGVPEWLKSAVKTELFIKIGLVLLGAEILFNVLLSAGAVGLFEITLGLFIVWYFCYHLAIKMRMGKSFACVMASATSICGVSAAIAAGGAVKGDPKEVSYTISLVLLFAMPMLVLMPMAARIAGLPAAVTGAWIGGTIDTTPAVVAAGALYDEKAVQVASIIKMSQNVLIGITAFLLALYWVVKVDRKADDKPKPMEIWYRFPKFVLGFVIASLVFSFLLLPALGNSATNAILNVTKGIRGWYFAMAFVCIGLETRFRDLVKTGRGKPLVVFTAATVLDAVISLISAYVFFGGVLFPSPF